jgi:hypothetical protein
LYIIIVTDDVIAEEEPIPAVSQAQEVVLPQEDGQAQPQAIPVTSAEKRPADGTSETAPPLKRQK